MSIPSPDRSAWFDVGGSIDPTVRVAPVNSLTGGPVVSLTIGGLVGVRLTPAVTGDLYRALGDTLAELADGPAVGTQVHPSDYARAAVAC